MGYTTNFEGEFRMDRLPPSEVIVKMRELEGADGREMSDADAPNGGYCQWQLTRDCRGIEWDGGEKFYQYTEWLQYIIDKVLTPAGVTLSGAIAYSGEDVKDMGTITIKDNKAVQIPGHLVSDEIAELQAFREYVLKSRFANELSRGWQKHKTANQT